MLKKIFSTKISTSIKTIHGNYFTRSFATGCEKITVAKSELEETFSNNFNDIKSSAKNKGFLVSSYYLERLAGLQKGDKELFETLYHNLMTSNIAAADESSLIYALKGITNKHVLKHLSTSRAETLLQTVHKRILEIQYLFNVSQKKEINSTLRSWNDALLGNNEYSLLEEKASSTEEVLKSLDPNGKLAKIRSKLVIHEYDVERSKAVVEFPAIGRIVTMMGVEPNPKQSMDNVLGVLMNDQKKFKTLVLEDAPTDLSPNLGPIDHANFINNTMQLRKFSMQTSWLEGFEAQEYIEKTTKDPQLFNYDPITDTINIFNPILGGEIPHGISTVVYRFNKKARGQNLDPTIHLADITLQELQAYYMKEKSLKDIQELHSLLNYISVLENLSTANDLSAKGCMLCTGREDYQLPRDGQLVVAGGEELPLDKRNEFLAFSLVDAALRTVGNFEMEIFALFGSYNLLRIIQKLIFIFENVETFAGWTFNRKNLVTEFFEIEGLTNKKTQAEMLEKLAILDNILQFTDQNALENISLDTMREDLQTYSELTQKYAEQSNLEYLCGSNKGSYKYSGERCLGEAFIFGTERAQKSAEKHNIQHVVPDAEIPKRKVLEDVDDDGDKQDVLVLKSDTEIKSKRRKNKK